MTATIRVRKVTWTETHEATVGCGHQACGTCGAVTPEPTDEQLIAFAKANPRDHFMWPDGQDWTPEGWQWSHVGLLCPGCVAVTNAALAKRRGKRGAR